MDLIVYHIWLLELPHMDLISYLASNYHMDLIVYHIRPRTTTYGLDSVSYLARTTTYGLELPHMDLIVYHIWPRTTTY